MAIKDFHTQTLRASSRHNTPYADMCRREVCASSTDRQPEVFFVSYTWGVLE